MLSISINLKNLVKTEVGLFAVLKLESGYKVYSPTKTVGSGGWESTVFSIDTKEVIKGIFLMLSNKTDRKIDYEVLFGGIAIYDEKMSDGILD